MFDRLKFKLKKALKYPTYILNKKYFWMGFFVVLIVFGIASFTLNKNVSKVNLTKSENKVLPSGILTPSPSVTAAISPSTTQKNKARITFSPVVTKAIVTAAPSSSPTVTSAQTKDTTAPVITTMTGPENGQTVNFNNFCFPTMIVDNVSKFPNLFVKTKFDSSDWTDWNNNVAPCFNNVSNGSHTFSIQVKDEAGNQSNVISRTFTVSIPQEITVSVTGNIYRDENCNNNKDTNETGISGVVVNIFKNPEFSLLSSVNTDSNGGYSYSKNISETDSLAIQVVPVSPSGYKNNGTGSYTVNLTSGFRSANHIISQVPNESVELCQ